MQIKNHQLMKLSTYITVAGVCLIIMAKIYGWIITDSVTILASLVDSLLDACVSMMNLLAVHYSLQPPDHEHRFGHGKAEDIAVFVQSVFFGLSGIMVAFAATQRFFNPSEHIMDNSFDGIAIMLFSILVTLVIFSFQHYVIKRTRSIAIEADALHYLTDFFANIMAIIGIAMVYYFKLSMFDSITAILISFFIIYNAVKMFKKALNNLMDHELGEDARQMIIDIIKSHNKALGFHDLKTRHAGTRAFIQFHLELDNTMILKEAHGICHDIEQSIISRLEYAEVIIHLDPDDIVEEVSYKD